MARDPHRDQPIFTWGTPLGEAVTAMVMLHGRGGSVDDMRALATELDRAEVAFIAPAAAGRTWYPYSFLEPIKRNCFRKHREGGGVRRCRMQHHRGAVGSTETKTTTYFTQLKLAVQSIVSNPC